MHSAKRGSLNIIYTNTLFVNDDEEAQICLDFGESEKLPFSISFKNLKSPYKRPTILIEEKQSFTHLRFIGWGEPGAYAAMEPIVIASIGKRKLRLAACNTKLGETNKLEIQLYLE